MKRPFIRLRNKTYRQLRILFPSPAEIALIRLLGGVVLTLPFLRNPFRRNRRAAFPLACVIYKGHLFRTEHVEREVRVGRFYVDFGNDICRAIEVMSDEWHPDMVAEFDRMEYIESYGWEVLYVWASDIQRRPRYTKQRVREFLLK